MCCLFLDTFSSVKISVFHLFSLPASRYMWNAITGRKLERGGGRGGWGGGIGGCFGTADAVWEHEYLRFESGAQMWNKGLSCLSAACNIFIPWMLFKFSHRILHRTILSWNTFGNLSRQYIDGSVEHIVYRDYSVNRSLSIFWPKSSDDRRALL